MIPQGKGENYRAARGSAAKLAQAPATVQRAAVKGYTPQNCEPSQGRAVKDHIRTEFVVVAPGPSAIGPAFRPFQVIPSNESIVGCFLGNPSAAARGCGAVPTMVVSAQRWNCSLLAMASDPLSADQGR